MVNNYFQYLLCFLIFVLWANAEEAAAPAKKKFVPPGMNPDMFPVSNQKHTAYSLSSII